MATATDSLSRVYARSLFELAEAAGGRDKIIEVGDELEQIVELARGDAAFREFLRSPVIDQSARGGALNQILSDRVTDLTLRFLLVLNDRGRLDRLESIQAAYDHLQQESFGRVEVDVFTPAPLGSEQQAAIRDRIQQALHREPVLYTYTDPSMIGGIRLRIGDQLIDASVATRLRRLRERLLAGGHGALSDRMDRLFDESAGA